MTPDTDTIRGRTVQAIGSQKRPTVTVLSSLLAAQDELGYLPDEAIEEIATFTESTINEVWGVASFYTNFRFTPAGRACRGGVLGPHVSPGRRPPRPAGPARLAPPGGRGRDGGRAGFPQVQHLPRRLLTGARYKRRPQARGKAVPAVGRRARPAGRRAGRLSAMPRHCIRRVDVPLLISPEDGRQAARIATAGDHATCRPAFDSRAGAPGLRASVVPPSRGWRVVWRRSRS